MATASGITTVIFDLGGVLVRTHWERFAGPVGRAVGLSARQVMEELVRGDAYRPFMRGELDVEGFHRRLCRQFGLTIGLEELVGLWESVIAPYGLVWDLVERVGRRYRLALGSNTDVLHHRRGLEVEPSLRAFRDGILSFRLGLLKPDPEFFRRGLAELSACPEECLFIDDRPDNVASARQVGLTALLYRSPEGLEADLVRRGVL